MKQDDLKIFDKHHIIPKCLGGSNASKNIIKLAPTDHLFAHVLLAHIYGGLLIYALICMSGNKRFGEKANRKKYQFLREQHVRMNRERSIGRKLSKEHKEKISKALVGNKCNFNMSEERRAQVGEFMRKRIQQAKDNGTYIPPGWLVSPSEETRKKIGIASREKALKQWQDPEQRLKIEQSNRANWSKPENKKAHSVRMKIVLSGESARAKISQANRDTWADPEVRARRMSGLLPHLARLNAKKKVSVQ